MHQVWFRSFLGTSNNELFLEINAKLQLLVLLVLAIVGIAVTQEAAKASVLYEAVAMIVSEQGWIKVQEKTFAKWYTDLKFHNGRVVDGS